MILLAAAVSGIFCLAPTAYGFASRFGSVSEWGGPPSLSTAVYLRGLMLRIIRLWTLPVALVLVGRRMRGTLFVCACVIGFLFYTCEADLFGKVFLPSLRHGIVTVFWSVLAFAGIWFGIVQRAKAARVAALALLGIAIVKLLAFDTAHLASPARVAVFSLTGVLLIVGAFLYIRFKERFEAHG